MDHEVSEIYKDYMQDAYLHSESIIMVPNETVNAFYYVFSGTISVYNIERLNIGYNQISQFKQTIFRQVIQVKQALFVVIIEGTCELIVLIN